MPKPVTLGMVGHFPNPYRDAKDAAARKQAAMVSHVDGRWNPDEEDFQTVLSKSAAARDAEIVKVRSLGALLASLAFGQSPKNMNQRRSAGSIGRIDLLSHASPSLVALAGTIVLPKAADSFAQSEVFLSLAMPGQRAVNAEFFNQDAFDSIEESRESISVSFSAKGPQVSFDDCLKSFTGNARLVCYLCHGAQIAPKFGVSILQGLADMLRIEVGGFTTLIKYTYVDGAGIRLSLVDDRGQTHGKPTFDYRDLDSADVFKVFSPTKK